MTGANIGEVDVISHDPATGAPLFTHAADSSWGQKFDWAAPSVKAFVDKSPADPATQ